MYRILYTLSTFNMFNLQNTHFQFSHKKTLVKILVLEDLLNQLTDKVRRNVKVSKYFSSVMLD